MIFLIALILTLRANKAATRYGKCTVNIDGHLFDFSDLEGKIKYFISPPYVYYMSLCGELTNDDLPNYDATGFDPKDVQVARCKAHDYKPNIHTCEPILYVSSFDWKLFKADDFDSGVILFAEDFDINGYAYSKNFMQVMMHCGMSNETNPEANLKLASFLSSFTQNETTISIPNSLYGCQQIVEAPTPTPPFSPQCSISVINPDDQSNSIEFDLKFLNNGPYGNRIPLDINTEKKILFFQPCERIECPYGYNCGQNSKYSSAWLCDENNTCQSYGIAEDIILSYENNEHGTNTRAIYSDQKNDKNLNIIFTCESFVPPGYMDILSAEFENQNLTLTVGTSNSCYDIKPVQPQITADSNCSYVVENEEYITSFDLDVYDLDTSHNPEGWKQSVIAKSQIEYSNSEILYNPYINLISCPNNSFCDGMDEANLYHCYDDITSGIYNRTCDGFGFFNSSTNVIYNALDESFVATYFSIKRAKAELRYQCNSNLKYKQLVLSSIIDRSVSNLELNIYAPDACKQNKFPPTNNPNKSIFMSYGAIAIYSVAGIVILYISIGFLVTKISTGKATFPNIEFWQRICCCCKSKGQDPYLEMITDENNDV